MKQQQAKRGTVVVEAFRGMLRLRWTHQGKRYTLSEGKPDGQINRVVAEKRAKTIEEDILKERFDPTLEKYRSEAQKSCTGVTVVALLEKYRSHKSKTLYPQSLGKIDALKSPLKEFFGVKPATVVDEEAAERFSEYLSDRMSSATLKERLINLNACWQWGIKQKLVTVNPWTEVKRSVKVPRREKPQVFSQEEARAIVQGFRESRYYRHYADFVEFFLGTGSRPSEIRALTWAHLSDDFSTVWIKESMMRNGTRKPPKNNRDRRFKVSPRLQVILKERYQGQAPTDLVFPAPKGGHIDDNNFRGRAWTSVLDQAGIPYRYPYTCRHTFISHALNNGTNFLKVAGIAGHDPKVMLDRYASPIGELQAPDLLGL